MKIIPLSEGSFTIDKTKKFVPFDDASDNLQERSKGSLLVEVQPFVVITSEDILLLDAGLGFEKDGELQLYTNLKAAGIEPDSITKVLMTHLHKDHGGGVGRFLNASEEVLSFPQARYYIQKKELDYAFEKGLPSFIPRELEVLKDNPAIELLDGNGVIAGYISYELTGGHSPFHQVFRIVDGGETVFFGGDEAPTLHQMKNKFMAKYDFDGRKSMELRKEWREQGEREHWTFLFYHDIHHPTFRFGDS